METKSAEGSTAKKLHQMQADVDGHDGNHGQGQEPQPPLVLGSELFGFVADLGVFAAEFALGKEVDVDARYQEDDFQCKSEDVHEFHRESDFGGDEFFKIASLAILAHIVPIEVATIHDHVDTRRQGLNKGQGAAEVEKPIRRSPKGIGHHGPGDDDGLVLDVGRRQGSSSLHHAVGPVGQEDALAQIFAAVVDDDVPVLLGHLQAIDHHEGLDVDVEGTSPSVKHFLEVGVFEIKLSGDEVVLFVKSPSCDKNLNHWRLLFGAQR